MEGLVGIALLGVSALLAMFFLSAYLGNQQTVAQERDMEVVMTSVPPTGQAEVVDLWQGYGWALGVARAEAEDAQLVSASAQWQAAREEALMAGAEVWAFTFYSPAAGQMLDVTVNAEKVRVVNRSETGISPALLTNGKWHAGPRDALLIFLAHGAREFLETHPQATVELHLNQHEDGYPAWSAIAIDPQARVSCSAIINAATMQTVSVVP
jgi:hypothetical protein